MKFEELCRQFPEIDGIKFISESQLDRSRKTYLLFDAIIKSREFGYDETAHLRQNDLKAEYDLLKQCKNIKGLPDALYYCKNSLYEILFINYVPGIQLKNLKLSFVKFVWVAIHLARLLVRLSREGISHNDISPENILITDDNNVSLIDLDQATKHNPVIALIRQFTGINFGKSKLNYSFITIVKDYLRKRFPRFVFTFKRILGLGPEIAEHKLPTISNDNNPKVKLLLKAWEIAQKSNASSPGLPIAYYEINFSGYKFPGERRWSDRWDRFKNVTNYSGKTIIELGCNMGLLSTFLLKERGALKCIGVDYDSKILDSAKIISDVFDVKPEFHQVDFDSKKNWEEKLLSYNAEIIFALNVLNWINDKRRFLKFLSNFPEVIFEGHDLAEVEKNRFEEIGFTKIEEVGFSERERIILRCRK